MGSWSVYCGVSKIAITSGMDCVLLPLKPESGMGYIPYVPATLPIYCKYNDYGGVEDIVEDENTKLIEKHFKLSIDEFCEGLTRRPYVQDEVPEEMKTNEELENWNYMFVERKVYDFMTTHVHSGYGGKGHLDFGNPGILTLLGFTKSDEPTNDTRYTQMWLYGDKKFKSDGTWIHSMSNGAIYTFDGEYNSLCDAITIPEDKKWIGEKGMWELWRHYDKTTRAKNLYWIIGLSYSYYQFDSLIMTMESLKAKILENDPNADISKFEDLEKSKVRSIADRYVQNFETFGDAIAGLVSFRKNLHCMSGWFEPYRLYVTPQDGEHKDHQVLLDKFAEINREIVKDRYEE